MSRALQICLMILTAALCGVCVLQWQREGRAAAREQALAAELGAAKTVIQSHTGKLAAWEQEITRLNAALSEQAEAQKALPGLETKLQEARQQLEAKTSALTQLSGTAGTLGAQLKQAMDERDALAVRLNERTREFNALAAKLRKVP